MTATNIHYETGRARPGPQRPAASGPCICWPASIGLIEAIDRNLHLLKRHLPYHESDHVLNIAYNILAGGKRIEHLELRRNDEVYLDALGAERIPDPTTAGDFCRRFAEPDVVTLMDAINQTRLRVWEQQPAEFFDEAIIDADGTLVADRRRVQAGHGHRLRRQVGLPSAVDLAGQHRGAAVPGQPQRQPAPHEQADVYLDKAIDLCRRAGFRKILLRGDTDFTQTKHLDRWDDAGDVRFIFGIDATANLKALADDCPAEAYSSWSDRPRYEIKTEPRSNPNVKEQIVRERSSRRSAARGDGRRVRLSPGRLQEGATGWSCCGRSWGWTRDSAAVRGVSLLLLHHQRPQTPAEEIVFSANDRCDQENLIAQLKSGVHALTTPVDNLVSNWAYMVMASLAWTLKAWCALLLPVAPRHAAKHRSRETIAAADGVQHVLRGDDAAAVPDRADGRRIIYRCCRGTHGKGCSCVWSSGCTAAGCAEPVRP